MPIARLMSSTAAGASGCTPGASSASKTREVENEVGMVVMVNRSSVQLDRSWEHPAVRLLHL